MEFKIKSAICIIQDSNSGKAGHSAQVKKSIGNQESTCARFRTHALQVNEKTKMEFEEKHGQVSNQRAEGSNAFKQINQKEALVENRTQAKQVQGALNWKIKGKSKTTYARYRTRARTEQERSKRSVLKQAKP